MSGPPLLSRRRLLGSGLLGAFAGLLAPQDEQFHRILPQVRHAAGHGGGEPEEPGPVELALQRRVTSLQGFSPMSFLTGFDRGRATRLPSGGTLREYEIVARDVDLEIAPGLLYPAWTYNGTVPGPTLRCTEGDRVRVRFLNRSISDHTIHFHGIHAADMDGVVEIVHPGASYVYDFTARPAGLHLYHCHVPPVDLHMSRGLFGAFLVDPPRPREEAREMVLVTHGWDVNFDGRNEIYAVNGPANFYRDNPIRVRSGELLRVYFVNALEHDPVNSLHLHANFFRLDRTGQKPEPDEVADVVTLGQAERCVLEFSYDLPGLYMFHAHQNRFAERGWMAHFEVV